MERALGTLQRSRSIAKKRAQELQQKMEVCLDNMFFEIFNQIIYFTDIEIMEGISKESKYV